jgi:hypothetical protein
MTSSTERAVLAGGCFWGMQDLIRKMPGVISTRVGYSGGDVANATYRHHGTHAEAIEIMFDPKIITFRTLLEFFFQIHDPTSRNRQGNDVGTSGGTDDRLAGIVVIKHAGRQLHGTPGQLQPPLRELCEGSIEAGGTFSSEDVSSSSLLTFD